MKQFENQSSRRSEEQWHTITPTAVNESEEPNVTRINTIASIVEELVEQRHGRHPISDEERQDTYDEMYQDTKDRANWVHFPWAHEVVTYPAQENHLKIRTWRNRDLITEAEQNELYDSRIAVFGLSVGSNVVDQLSQSGIGNEYLLADSDVISPSNLNRIRATMAEVGLKKTTVAGRKLARVDPYIQQVRLDEGYKGEETDDLLREYQPDIIFDEVDNLAVKAMIRRVAKDIKKPVVMVGDIGERSILEVERYDQDDTVSPFNGKLPQETYERLLKGEVQDQAEIMQLLIQLNGMENISERLLHSAMNPELGGLPQLGATASAGAALADKAVRAILLENNLPSGTYVANPESTLRLA